METNQPISLKPLIEELRLAGLRHNQLMFGLEALQLDYHFTSGFKLDGI